MLVNCFVPQLIVTNVCFSIKEIYESLAHYDLPVEELFIDFRILLSIMEQFEQELRVGHTRLLFWFDN